MAFSIKFERGFHIIGGEIDETSDFTELGSAASPIRLNMRAVTKVNSVGLGRLLNMVLRRFDAKLEYHECPYVFVQIVNTIPRLLGERTDPKVIKSVIAPFQCPGCHSDSVEVLDMAQVQREGTTVRLEPRPCERCGILRRLAVDADDFFEFLAPDG